MNERIRQLAKQAENMALAIPGSLSPEQFREIEQDIFAELIVKECASVAYKTAWDDLTLDYGTGAIPLHIHNTIKEHFGVE
jgi:hypothetical protein